MCTTLFLIFLVLKLTGLVTWSWWFVFAPLWIRLIIGILAAIRDNIGDFDDYIRY